MVVIFTGRRNHTEHHQRHESVSLEIAGEFSKVFGTVHAVDYMAGLELRRSKVTDLMTRGFGYDPNSLTTKPLVFPEGSSETDNSDFKQYSKSFNEDRFLSVYMTGSYTYDNRYTFSVVCGMTVRICLGWNGNINICRCGRCPVPGI